MDPRVTSIAEGALRRMGPDAHRETGGALRIGTLTLAQLSDLAALRPDDPLVAQVVRALRDGVPVSLDRDRVESDLGLRGYPPQLREQFERWFSRIADMGVAVAGSEGPRAAAPSPAQRAPEPPAAQPAQSTLNASPARPERQVFDAILGAVDPAPHPCFLEPGKPCAGCSGRCRTLGF